MSGLLNLVAWAKENEGHLVPHGHLPDGFSKPGDHSTIMVVQNALRNLRHRVIVTWNPRRVLDPLGRWVAIRKLGDAEFEESNVAPLYGSEDDVRTGRLRGVYLAPNRSWWIEIEAPEAAPRKAVYEHWVMLCVWLRRAAPILGRELASLPDDPISIVVRFSEIVGPTSEEVAPKSLSELRSIFEVVAHVNDPRIYIGVGRQFDDGLFQAENTAERLLVEALIQGVLNVAGEGEDVEKKARLLAEICPDEARHIHRFQARSYRDYLVSEIAGRPISMDPLDHAACRVGLGWKVRSRDSGPEILGVAECTTFLNDVVRVLLAGC